MTGYGAFEKKNNDAQIYVEIKSLNSRFFDFYSKSCKTLSVYDDEVKNKIKDLCFRGNFQLKTKITFLGKPFYSKINKKRLDAYLKIKDDIIRANNGSDCLAPLSIDKLISMPDIYEVDEIQDSVGVKKIKRLYIECVDAAILDLNQSRELEGENIKKALNKNLNSLDKSFKKISKLHEKNINQELEKYKEKISKILESNDIDENRLYQEVAIIIDKKDINEEVVRLESHLNILKGYLLENDEIGKKINFILQEIHREVNTIGSKTDKLKVSHLVVELKAIIEKIKEQIQNIL